MSSAGDANRTTSGGNADQDFDLSLYFLSWGLGLAPTEADEPEEQEPMELNTVNTVDGFLSVSVEKLSVKDTNINLHGHDVGVVQANWPAPVKRLVYYFEMFVKNTGAKGQVAIGFTTKREREMERQGEGWIVTDDMLDGEEVRLGWVSLGFILLWSLGRRSRVFPDTSRTRSSIKASILLGFDFEGGGEGVPVVAMGVESGDF